jgi:flagellar biosynthetic protein FlhB
MFRGAFQFGHEDPLETVSRWLQGPLAIFALWLLGFLVVGVLAGLAGPLLLNAGRPVFRLKLDLSRLDPVAGIGRMFSVRNLFALAKGLAVTILLAAVALVYFYGAFDSLLLAPTASLSGAMTRLASLVGQGVLWIMAAVAAIALMDTAFQMSSFRREMRMTYQELRDELKESEGSPEVRQRLRSLQRSRATRRTMAAVEQADVLIVNPTHYAVALKYQIDTMAAPIVVAKGADEVALRMRSMALSSAVPVAQAPSLARWLTARVDVGEPIPPTAYAVVARVLAWAYEAKARPESSIPLDSSAGDSLE